MSIVRDKTNMTATHGIDDVEFINLINRRRGEWEADRKMSRKIKVTRGGEAAHAGTCASGIWVLAHTALKKVGLEGLVARCFLFFFFLNSGPNLIDMFQIRCNFWAQSYLLSRTQKKIAILLLIKILILKGTLLLLVLSNCTSPSLISNLESNTDEALPTSRSSSSSLTFSSPPPPPPRPPLIDRSC